ncbi:hypothetical protein [Nocardia sp. R6R-6]|uniref:hypothetical protein n=1 Tax=Nocardia sp. R6R-6 TaxID=3459303 RepID=UPI00403DAF46
MHEMAVHTNDLPQRTPFRHADHEVSDRSHLHLLGMAAYTSSGIIGRPSAATDVKGKAVLDALTKSFGEYFALIADTEG